MPTASPYRQTAQPRIHSVGRLYRPNLLAAAILSVACGSDGPGAPRATVSSVAMYPSQETLPIGGSVHLIATAHDARGNEVTTPFTWSSDNEAVATVSNAGLVSAVAPGIAWIAATAEGQTGQSFIKVNPPPELTVAGWGDGDGTITSMPAGISCIITDGVAAATGCRSEFRDDTQVTLTATPGAGSTLSSWSWERPGLRNGCSGAGACVVTMYGPHYVRAMFIEAFVTVSAGGRHSCGITRPGAAYCWGSDQYGPLGNGTRGGSNVPEPVIGGLTFATVSAGGSYSCGIVTTGATYCWGANFSGTLGNGTNSHSDWPVPVSGGLTFATVSAGTRHSCGVTPTGATYCWGDNTWGGLGNGTSDDSGVPLPVIGGLTFATVSAGGFHSCGVTPTGATYCWGDNKSAQLGVGSDPNGSMPGASSVPVPVSGGLTFTTVNTRAAHSCGLVTTGATYCWGANNRGGLGNGTFDDSGVPLPVIGGLTFATVSAGGSHSCGIVTTGAAYCWGGNTRGGLGNGTTNDSNVPVPVSGGLTFVTVSAGDGHSCGVTTAGVAYCWGNNDRGQLGNETTNDSNVPVRVGAP